ncbi:uncharacterized protein LOC112324026 isoform X4 [Populus trichocarpa]|uniref:uncharacterized protein LOC112324026 isoform X4 n=1 Tax=Populus trichocarpa TaxID=3694 RepID=UPI0022776A3F|nr:uncharacterized protein LOC112324026 isoform X4 [Populus trichocarpa]
MDDYFSSVLPILLLLMEQGFKFDPSDEELIRKYLVPKTRGDIMRGLPMAVVNLCEHEPWDLPGKSIIKLTGQVAWYFLCPRDLRGKVHRRKTKAGYWKPTSQQKSITAEHTNKKIGVVRTLRFYEKQVRTGWMIYEFDLIAESSQFKKGQFVLCKLEFDSKGEKSKKGEQSHHIAPVSHSEVEPSQSMDSDSENINPSEMAMRYSPCDESELSHHAGSHFGNQNPSELMNNSARQLSELSHHMASDSENNLMPNLVYDGSGSSHSTVFNCEDLYWNQPTVDSAYNGSESLYMAFDSENQNPNELPTVDNSASNVSKNHGMAFGLANHNPNVSLTVDNSTSNVSESHHMALVLENQNLNNSISILTCENSLMASRGLENQEPFFPPCSLINQSTYDKSESSSLMDFDFENQNLVKEFDISAFCEGVWSNTTATPPDFGNQNPCKKTDMSTLEEGYSSYFNSSSSDNDLADVALPEQVSPGLQAEIEGCFEQENIPNPALVQLPAYMEESHSFRGFGTLENQEPFFSPRSFINQSTYDKSESSSLMNFDFGNQNLVKEFDISAFGEGVWSNTTATPPDFGNQNPCKKTDMSTLEEGYSSYFNSSSSDNDLADVALPEVSPGPQAEIEGCFEQENIPNPALVQLPACMEESHSFRGFGTLENQEPFFPSCSFINQSTYDKSESSSLMNFDFGNQNLVKEFDISAFGEGVWSNTTATPPDFGNQNPCKKTDMSTPEEGYSSYFNSSSSDNDLADVAHPEQVSPGLQAEIEGCFEQENIPNPALVQLPAYMEESHSFRGFGTLENQEPFFPPCSFINQSTYDKSESSSLMNFDFGNQNLVKEFDISAFGEGVWSNTTATPPDFGNQNPCKKSDMSTLEEGYSSYFNSSSSDNDLADVALPEVRTKYHALQILFNFCSGVGVANPKLILTLYSYFT